ncbi:MAG: hypothetical protein FWH50_03010, partial [Coriobacteriia bacterium]|nr:hypothetical protein [Coriobacteriia bacterium]
MTIYISHQTALDFWRQAPANKTLTEGITFIRKAPIKLPALDSSLNLGTSILSLPLHTIVASNDARRQTKHMFSHVYSMPLPAGSFVRATPDLMVSSPDFCFQQMANVLSFVESIALGCEFTGSYRLDKWTEPERGFRDDQPLSSVAKLESFVAKAAGVSGCVKARKALPYIIENSASPMETVIAILLTLPYRYGGFGLPQPTLNMDIDANARFKTSP